jgi:tetratricopeptide (TPR) repeat protein
MVRPRLVLFVTLLSLLVAGSASSASSTKANDREWSLLLTDYQWLENLRKAQAQPPPGSSRKVMIETELSNLEKLQPTWNAFDAKVRDYYDRTHDARAAKLIAREKILMGDQFMGVLSRYDRAITFYQDALAIDPENADAKQRISIAESRRFVAMSAFANVKNGMKEDDVRGMVGLPREDWIKQVVQNNRVYSVWIYPKSDGGAAAIYFDNGVVYHTNWNAAAPPAAK